MDNHGSSYNIIKYLNLENTDFSKYSGIIISSAPTLLTEVDLKLYHELFGFVKMKEIPILGICLGHQIIGILFGSKIIKREIIKKRQQIEIIRPSRILLNVKNHSIFAKRAF